jgi:hypothetical protein
MSLAPRCLRSFLGHHPAILSASLSRFQRTDRLLEKSKQIPSTGEENINEIYLSSPLIYSIILSSNLLWFSNPFLFFKPNKRPQSGAVYIRMVHLHPFVHTSLLLPPSLLCYSPYLHCRSSSS